jgi:hypothetical protein
MEPFIVQQRPARRSQTDVTKHSVTDEDVGTLFGRHARAVHNHVFRLTGSWSLAEEIVQATFLTAWQRRADIRLVDSSPLPWLLVTAGNHARSEQRTLTRWRRRPAALARRRDRGRPTATCGLPPRRGSARPRCGGRGCRAIGSAEGSWSRRRPRSRLQVLMSGTSVVSGPQPRSASRPSPGTTDRAGSMCRTPLPRSIDATEYLGQAPALVPEPVHDRPDRYLPLIEHLRSHGADLQLLRRAMIDRAVAPFGNVEHGSWCLACGRMTIEAGCAVSPRRSLS